ncbi:MAG: hypothetical protein GEV08_11505 [Acidimicrobiia bacterium]|nr:hypothetical protein [Acidimicrobiia bacterium]
MNPRARRCRALGLVLALLVVAAGCTYETADVASLAPEVAQTSRIYAADGTLITELQAEQNRDLVTFAQLPRVLVDAVVAIEDDRYWEHHGIDLQGILRAAGSNAAAGEITQGGSTITQQYVKLALLNDPSQTANRKLREAVLAWQLEDTYSKETILERYLNTIYFGHGAYGVAAAAAVYFGRTLDELTPAQAALIAGLIQAPSATDPFLAPTDAVARRDVVLDRMLTLGYLAAPDHAAAVAEPLQLAPAQAGTYPAAHFVEAVKQWVLSDPRFGDTDEDRRRLLFQGGLRITTTVDLRLQAAAEEAIANVLVDDPSAYPSAAIVSVEPTSGAVRAMAGGRDYFGTSSVAKVNLAMGAGRQAGSTFKPFVLAAALAAGIPMSETYRAPARIDLDQPGSDEPWEVSNYGGSGGGTVSLLEATVWSYNTAYAQLMLDVGPAEATALANDLGITAPLLPVPAAVLGTENVTVLDMASAYATLANRGARVPPSFVSRITTADGRVVFENAPTPSQVLDTGVADQVTYALRQVVERGTGTDAQLDDRPVAGKTGTAEGYRDAWFCGYTPQLTTAVWVGFAEGQVPMVPPATEIQVTGGSWPTEIWHDYMAAALEGSPVHEFVSPPSSTLRGARSGGGGSPGGSSGGGGDSSDDDDDGGGGGGGDDDGGDGTTTTAAGPGATATTAGPEPGGPAAPSTTTPSEVTPTTESGGTGGGPADDPAEED